MLSTRQEILRRLREAQDYLSGQQISESLGISRTAVWKNIQSLKNEGYPIEAVTNRGYRLLTAGTDEADVFNEEEIARLLRTRWVGHPFRFYARTGSTNADVFRLSEEGQPQGTAAAAAIQTAGRGRRGRQWISPEGNIYMSILLKPALAPDAAPSLTLVMAMAVRSAVEEITGQPAWIKWPNDILMQDSNGQYRKICGILTEMRMEDAEIRDIVIGTGINVNQTVFPEEIRETASSLKLITGQGVSRSAMTVCVWAYFEQYCDIFLEHGGLAPLREAYEAALVNRGRQVRVLDPQAPFTGTAAGIDERGALLVRTAEGDLRRIESGEVSVRGIAGYV